MDFEFPFKKLPERDALRFPNTVVFIAYKNVDSVVYPQFCDMKQTTSPNAPHSLLKLVDTTNVFEAEVWNARREKPVYLAISKSGRNQCVLCLPVKCMLCLTDIMSSGDAGINVVLHLSREECVGDLFSPCFNTSTWIPCHTPRRALQRCKSLPIRLASIAEDSNGGAEPRQLSESVHDGAFFSHAVFNNAPRCPNERRYVRMHRA